MIYRAGQFSITVTPKCGTQYFGHFVKNNHNILKNLKANIYIYRCPIKRLISFYMGKILAYKGYKETEEYFSNIRAHFDTKWSIKLGIKDSHITFSMFVNKIKNIEFNDIHLLPQSWNFDNTMHYDLICDIDDHDKFRQFFDDLGISGLNYDMSNFNANKTNRIHFNGKCYDYFLEDFMKLGGIPYNVDCFLNPELKAIIEEIYKDDFKLISDRQITI